MGHIRLGILSLSKKRREVIDLPGSNASLDDIAEASGRASELDMARASSDPSFQFISRLLVELPLIARSPGFNDSLAEIGFVSNAADSVSKLPSEVSHAVDRNALDLGQSSDLVAINLCVIRVDINKFKQLRNWMRHAIQVEAAVTDAVP